MIPSAIATRKALTPPAFRVASSVVTTTTATSISVTIPATAVVGDMAILYLSANASTNPSVATPAGWTLLRNCADTDNAAVSPGPGLWIYYKYLVAGNPGTSVSFTGMDNTAMQAMIACYSGVGDIGSLPRVWFTTNATEPINNVPKHLTSSTPGPKDLVVGAVSISGYLSSAAGSCTVNTAPSGATIRGTAQSTSNSLQTTQMRGLGVWDAPSHGPQVESFASGNAGYYTGATFSLSPVGEGLKFRQKAPSSLVGQNMLVYGHSGTTRVPSGSALGLAAGGPSPNSLDHFNSCEPWPWRIWRAMGKPTWNHMGIAGACAEHITCFAYGNHAADTQSTGGQAAAVTQVGTFTAQPVPKLVLTDLYGNDLIFELSPASQVRDGTALAMEALFRLLRSSSVKGDGDISIVYSGGGAWTQVTSDGYFQGTAHQTTTPGATMTITTTENAIDLVLIAQDDAKAGAAGSAYTVAVNGTQVASGTVGNRMLATGTVSGQSLPDWGFVQMTVPLENLGSGTKTITVSHAGNSGEILRVQGWLQRSTNPPWIVTCQLAWFSPRVYDPAIDNYFNSTQDEVYRQLTRDVVAKFTDGKVILYDPRAGIFPNPPPSDWTLYDDVHQTDPGHAVYAAEILTMLNERIP